MARAVVANESGGDDAPDLLTHLDDSLQLSPLIRFGDPIALRRAREAALRADTQAFDGHISRGFGDPSRDVGHRLECR
jgi:hypothetical protein